MRTRIVTARLYGSTHKLTGDWSAVIVNYNGDPFLGACLAALENQRLRPHEIFVVDNASTDDSMRELVAYPRAEPLPQTTNLGFAGGANAGLERVETSYAVVLNPDVELDPGFGEALVGAFSANERLGVAGSLLLYPDGETIQHAGGVIGYPLMFTDHRGRGQGLTDEFEREMQIDFATGAAIGLRMTALREIDGWDTSFSPAYYEDVDISARMRARGYEVRLIPGMRGLHHEGVTLGHSPEYYVYLQRNRLLYALRHLTPEQWRDDFLPAEFQRLRYALGELGEGERPEVIGLEAIDLLLREVDPFAGIGAALTVPLSTGAELPDLDELHRTRAVQGRPLSSRIPLLGALRNALNALGPRAYTDAALAEQRAFNDAVVRAFERQRALDAAQDRLNRQRLAATLLLALVMLERVRSHGASSKAGEAEHDAGSNP